MTQSEALEILKSNANVFLSGPPGSGKSYIIEQYVNWAKKRGLQVAVTASTGVAASLIGGSTIHSWSGISTHYRSEKTSSDFTTLRLNKTQVLIIDEISMLSGSFLKQLDILLKQIRKNLQPFGGIKMVLCGDFYQLPPVGKMRGNDYAFLSDCWKQLKLVSCLLDEQHRQRKDQLYEVLTALRQRHFSRRLLDNLTARQGLPVPDTTILLTHNNQVEQINLKRLDMIECPIHEYTLRVSGNRVAGERIIKNLLSPRQLLLKEGSRVMFTANDFASGFVNGTQGVVIGFKHGLPMVELDGNGLRLLVEARTWREELNGKIIAEVHQLPLRLAWAMTIHKSQGMSLSSAAIDLSRSFSYGMGYVALSRLKSYEGLYLLGYNSRSLELDPIVHDFYAGIEPPSRQANYHQKVLTEYGVSDDYIALIS
jgi:ATP-dependent DNA helicase PIF1